ncbi:unnamed protein product [Darwinula stevensoni]|uniref:Uncharacterized protein n=1 Tax=Darwinula stevensoni TaxID=69355 RepID=A0A7R9FQT5_9CRUS|nr:unnamed protein product [Darwinula stevensoni]CAG0900373.1 unnamed protein product [Darwinula stevensoni]
MKESRGAQSLYLQEVLTYSGDSAFLIFLQALRRHEYTTLAENLEKHLEVIDINGILEDLKDQRVIEHADYVENTKKSWKEKMLFLREVLPLKEERFPKIMQDLRESGHVYLPFMLEQGHVGSLLNLMQDFSNEMPEAAGKTLRFEQAIK